MTVEHLPTMISGLGFDDSVDENGMWDSDDWIQVALDLEMTAEPGTCRNYHQPTAFLRSAIIPQATGMNLFAFAREHLFGPLRYIHFYWWANPKGHNTGRNELYITPHDFANPGQLFLQRGMWNGERILSQSWIDDATRVHVGTSYGSMWTIYRDIPNAYRGGRALGQRLVVSPDHDLVVALMGDGHAHEDIEAIYLEALYWMIMPAVHSEGPLRATRAG